jgi:hypothetical protein
MLAHTGLVFGLERVQLTFALRLDDSLQMLLVPPLVALRPFAETAVVPLSFTSSSSHVLTPREGNPSLGVSPFAVITERCAESHARDGDPP